MNKHIANFLIGFFACQCAVFVPRMLAMLNSGSGDTAFFSASYITVGMVFSLVIGGITVIFEAARKKTAAETFMTALGIPALLAGALNTGTADADLHHSEAEKQQLVEALREQFDTKVDEAAVGIKDLHDTGGNAHSQLDLSPLASAYAQTNKMTPESRKYDLGLRVEQKPYVVVLGKEKDKAAALKRAEELRKTIPEATAVQAGPDFLVVDGTASRSKAAAMLRAVELQKKTGLKPYLLQIK